MAKKPGIWSRIQRRAKYIFNAFTLKGLLNPNAILVSTSKSNVPVTEKNILSLPPYWRAINLISEQLASLPLVVYRRLDDGTIEEAQTHPTYKLLKYRPSQLFDNFSWRSLLVKRAIIQGNSFGRIYRDARGAISSIEMIFEPVQKVDQVNGTWYYYFSGHPPLRFDEVVHYKPYLFDSIVGQRPMDVLKETFGKGIAEIEYTASFFGNGANLSVLLSTDRVLDPNQANELVQAFKEKTSGADKVGSVGIVHSGIKAEQWGKDLNESALIQSREQTTQDISNITGVPLFLLAMMEKGSSYNSIEQMNRILVQYVIRPWCSMIESELNSKLFSERETGKMFVRHDLTDMLRGDTKSITQLIDKLVTNGIYNANEIRKEWFDKNPYEGGEKYLTPMNMEKNQESNEITDEEME